MNRTGGSRIIVAVFFATALLLGSSAQASNLFGPGGDSIPRAERQIGLFEQALGWLTGAWTDLKVAFSQDSTTSGPPPCTSPTGCAPSNGDSGWTIDPEG